MNEAVAGQELGDQRYIFRSGVHPVAWYGVLMLTLCFVFAVGMSYFIVGEGNGWYHALPMMGVAALTLSLAIWIPVRAYRQPVEWCALYEHGFAYRRGSADVVVARWDEIESILRADIEIGSGTNRTMDISVPGGLVALTNTFPQAEELFARLEEAYTRDRLPRVAAMVSGGAVVPFGELSLDSEGVRHAGGVVEWGRVRKVTVDDAHVKIFVDGQRSPEVSVTVFGFPDRAVFAAMADARRTRDRPE